MDVPAPDSGTIIELTVKVGDTISSGDSIGTMTVEVSDTVVDAPAVEADPVEDDTAVVAVPEVAGGGKQTLDVPDLGDFDDVEVIEVHIAAVTRSMSTTSWLRWKPTRRPWMCRR